MSEEVVLTTVRLDLHWAFITAETGVTNRMRQLGNLPPHGFAPYRQAGVGMQKEMMEEPQVGDAKLCRGSLQGLPHRADLCSLDARRIFAGEAEPITGLARGQGLRAFYSATLAIQTAAPGFCMAFPGHWLPTQRPFWLWGCGRLT